MKKDCALHNNNDDYCQAELSFAEKEIVKIKCVFDTCELSTPNTLQRSTSKLQLHYSKKDVLCF